MATRPLLLYDGDCPMCGSVVRLLARLDLTAAVRVAPWQESELADEDLSERIRTEILLYDPDKRHAVGGLQALTQLLESRPRYRWLAPLLRLPPVRMAGNYVYRLVAYNRRILSPPPPRPIACACDPPDNPPARQQLYLWLGLLAALGFSALAAGLERLYGLPFADTLLDLLSWQALAWGLFYLTAFWLLRKRFADLFAQTLVILACGGLLLVAISPVLPWLPAVPAMLFLPLALHALLMLAQFFRRSQALALPAWLPWLWLSLYAAASLFTGMLLFEF